MNEKKKEEGSQSFYRCKYKDNKNIRTSLEKILSLYHSKANPRVASLLWHTMERGNEYIFLEKYVPKTKTNGITIPLKNRVMVCASIANLGAESY